MSILQNITIKNFRGFDSLEVNGFSQINLLIGNNNSGKSSILEAIFLLIGMSNPMLPDNINRLRGLNIKSAEEFKFLYYKLKLSNIPEISGIFSDTTERNLKLNPVFKKIGHENGNQKILTDELTIDASTATPNMSGLELEFSIKQRHAPRKNFKSSIIFNLPEIKQTPNPLYKEELHAVMISGNTNELAALSRYSEIVKKKKGDIVLSALQKIDPRIESIHPLPDGLYFSYEDIDELMPSNIAGDGVRKFLSIITTIAEKRDSIILIDEIENGLHYSAHKFLWESIITIANEFNVQLFITSHNIETLKCLKELLDTTDYKSNQSKLSVFTVSHTKKSGIKTYKYSFNGFKDAIDSQTEIRK
jgi:AAA15 family ATPase/GTPase